MEQPTNLMMITGLLTFDQVPEVRRLKETLRHRLCWHERFRCKVVEPTHGLGLPAWVEDPEFDLDRHMVVEELGDCTDAAFMGRISQLMSQPLERGRPLWEFRLFPGQAGGAAMLVRLHHAIGDGIALMRVLLKLCDLKREAPWPEPLPPRVRAQRQQGSWERARRLANHLLHEGHELLFHPGQAIETGQALARVLSLPPDTDTAFRGPLSQTKVAAVSPVYDLAAIKQLSKRLSCTINDLLMCTLAGGLGRSLSRFQTVPPNLLIRGVVPVDLRGGHAEELGNRFGLVFLTLPVGISDPRERLHQVRQGMSRLKCSPEALVTYELLSAVGLTPADIEKSIIEWFGNKATAVVTNLPGPQQQLYLAKARIESVMYWVPQSGRLGLGVSILSYAGQVRVGIATDAGLIPDPQLLQEDFRMSYEEMEAL